MDGTTAILICQIESLGYAVAVRRFGSGVQMSAASLADPDVAHAASNAGGDGEDEEYHCACELARAVGVELEDG